MGYYIDQIHSKHMMEYFRLHQ